MCIYIYIFSSFSDTPTDAAIDFESYIFFPDGAAIAAICMFSLFIVLIIIVLIRTRQNLKKEKTDKIPIYMYTKPIYSSALIEYDLDFELPSNQQWITRPQLVLDLERY